VAGKSVDRFCKDWGISRATFYNSLRRGEGPTTMIFGGRRLISEEAEESWRVKCEAAAARLLLSPRENSHNGHAAGLTATGRAQSMAVIRQARKTPGMATIKRK
jgi:hypothetical protein